MGKKTKTIMTSFQEVGAQNSHAKKMQLYTAIAVVDWLDVRAMGTCNSGVICFKKNSIVEDFLPAD